MRLRTSFEYVLPIICRPCIAAGVSWIVVSEAAPPTGPSISDILLDACLYAPLGFLFEAPSLLPKLAERGRNQVRVAQMIGKFAVTRLSGDRGGIRIDPEQLVGAALSLFGVPTRRPTSPDAAPDADKPVDAGALAESPPSSAALPLADYDTLAASQVVPRK